MTHNPRLGHRLAAWRQERRAAHPRPAGQSRARAPFGVPAATVSPGTPWYAVEERRRRRTPGADEAHACSR